MQQNFKYAVIGNGRMATHLCHYFNFLNIPYLHWCRSKHDLVRLDEVLLKATHLLILIKDNEIDSFIDKYIFPKYSHHLIIHFSGCLDSLRAHSAHPLQTFNQNSIYSFDEYQKIPFTVDSDAPRFSELLPGLKNPHYRIAKKDRAYYHAMCVLANNVSTIMWQKFYSEMKSRFHINEQDLLPFLQRTFQNIEKSSELALTGPIIRKDMQTLQKDLDALRDDSFYEVFHVIVKQFAGSS